MRYYVGLKSSLELNYVTGLNKAYCIVLYCINPQTSKPLQNEPRKVLYKSSNHFDPFELRSTCIEKIFKSGNVRDYDLYGPTSSFGHTKKGLRIGNINVCHLNGKLDEIKFMLSNPQSIDILWICETFLNEKIPDSFLTI